MPINKLSNSELTNVRIESAILLLEQLTNAFYTSKIKQMEEHKQLKQIEKDTISAQLQRAGRTKENFHPKSDNYLKFIIEEYTSESGVRKLKEILFEIISGD